jgi:hypothetical protein
MNGIAAWVLLDRKSHLRKKVGSRLYRHTQNHSQKAIHTRSALSGRERIKIGKIIYRKPNTRSKISQQERI